MSLSSSLYREVEKEMKRLDDQKTKNGETLRKLDNERKSLGDKIEKQVRQFWR